MANLVRLFDNNPFADTWYDFPGIVELISEITDELKDGHYTGPKPSGTPTLDLTNAGDFGVINGVAFVT